jgi:hypothetical protein
MFTGNVPAVYRVKNRLSAILGVLHATRNKLPAGLPKPVHNRGRGAHPNRPAAARVRKTETVRVKPDPDLFAAAGAVLKVALNMEARGGKLGADLVAAAGDQFYLQKGIAFPLSAGPAAQYRFFSARTRFVKSGASVAAAVLA